MYVVMPLCVLLLVTSFALHPAVKVALLALAVSPVPPVLPRKEMKLVAPDRAVYVYGLLVAACLLSILVAPAVSALVAASLDIDVAADPLAVARVVFASVLLPLGVGLALHRWWPASQRLAGAAETIGMVLMVAAFALMVTRVWPAFGSLVGDGTLLAIVAVTLIAVAVGHLLGGPIDDDRTVLAFATAARHPGVAVAVASISDQALAPAAILLAVVVGAVATVPYAAWRRRLRPSAPAVESKPSAR
jgi:BASS family bile acid:Na+ symporter